MSAASTPIKVLRVALKRIQTRWSNRTWSEKGKDGRYYVCLEGAITGGCVVPTTQAQRDALEVCRDVVKEITGDRYGSIPHYNDASGRTQQQMEEIVKRAIIKIETGAYDPEDDYLSEEETDSLLG